jgi:hypothetical protein
MLKFLYHKSKIFNYIFRSGSKKYWDAYYKNLPSCSPSESRDEKLDQLKDRFPWIGPPTEPTPFDDSWDPSSSPTDSPEPDLDGMYLYLDISTIHITPRDRARLLEMNESSWLPAIQHEFGTIILIPEDVSQRQVVSNEFSKYFLLVFNYAVNSGARMINFDTDGQRLDDLFSKFEDDQ